MTECELLSRGGARGGRARTGSVGFAVLRRGKTGGSGLGSGFPAKNWRVVPMLVDTGMTFADEEDTAHRAAQVAGAPRVQHDPKQNGADPVNFTSKDNHDDEVAHSQLCMKGFVLCRTVTPHCERAPFFFEVCWQRCQDAGFDTMSLSHISLLPRI